MDADEMVLGNSGDRSQHVRLAQVSDPLAKWAAVAGWDYQVDANIVYKKASGIDQKLDVIHAKDKSKARPTLIYIHGGGWIGGTKEGASLLVLPYLARGFNVVNVEYRLASTALAPAAVEDCRCALGPCEREDLRL
jgi:acetyl esterase/lipase